MVANHTMRTVFSTGSQPQYPPHPSSAHAQWDPVARPTVVKAKVACNHRVPPDRNRPKLATRPAYKMGGCQSMDSCSRMGVNPLPSMAGIASSANGLANSKTVSECPPTNVAAVATAAGLPLCKPHQAPTAASIDVKSSREPSAPPHRPEMRNHTEVPRRD